MDLFLRALPYLVGGWLLYGLLRIAASRRRWAIYYSALTNDTHMLETALRKGSSPNCRTRDGRTPLMLAAAMGRTEACRTLLKYEARLGDTMRICRTELGGVGDYGTALHLATFCGHQETALELMKASDTLQALVTPDERGCTPLTIAAIIGYPALVKQMLKLGAEADPRDRAELTPLMTICAANYHSIQMMRSLVYDETKLEFALPSRAPIHFLLADGGLTLSKTAMLVYGSRLWFPFLTTRMHMPSPQAKWEEQLVKSAQLLLEAGADISIADAKGRTPLIMAAMMQREKLCKLLIEHGADAKHTDAAGNTYRQYLDMHLQPKPVGEAVEAKLRKLGFWD